MKRIPLALLLTTTVALNSFARSPDASSLKTAIPVTHQTSVKSNGHHKKRRINIKQEVAKLRYLSFDHPTKAIKQSYRYQVMDDTVSEDFDQLRLYGRFNQEKKSQGNSEGVERATISQMTVSADYLMDFGALKTFVGASLGTDIIENKVSAEGETEDSSSFAPAYGAQAGILGKLGAVEIEAGYRYTAHTIQSAFTNGQMIMEENTSQVPYLSIAYYF